MNFYKLIIQVAAFYSVIAAASLIHPQPAVIGQMLAAP